MSCDKTKDITDSPYWQRAPFGDLPGLSHAAHKLDFSESPENGLTRNFLEVEGQLRTSAYSGDRWDAEIDPLWVDTNDGYWPEGATDLAIKRKSTSSPDSDDHYENGGNMLNSTQWRSSELNYSGGASPVNVVTAARPSSLSTPHLDGRLARRLSNGTGLGVDCESDGSAASSVQTAASGQQQRVVGSLAGASDPSPLTRRPSSSSSAEGGRMSPSFQKSAATAAASVVQKKPETPLRDRRRAWFSGSYKQRSEEFRRFFKDVPADERLLVDYSCAMQKELLVHGRLYISQNWVCFYANIFRWETTVAVPLHSVAAITKERTAKFIPTLQVSTAKDRLVFTSFASRDKSYLMVFRAWQNALTEQPMSTQELSKWVRHVYGSGPDLASTSDIEDGLDAVAAATLPATDSVSGLNPTVSMADFARLTKDSMAITNGKDGRAVGGWRGGSDKPAAICHSASASAALALVADDLSPLERAAEVAESEPSLQRRGTSLNKGTASGASDTDASDTTEDDDDEDCSAAAAAESAIAAALACSRHQHSGRLMLDEEYNFSAQEVFTMLFTDTEIFRKFLDERKTTDVVIAPWPNEGDDAGQRQRINTYTIALNAPIGPKSTPATEIQTMHKECVPGTYYCVDCKCLNSPELLYGENFYVLNRYCILYLSKNRCRLIVHSDVVYTKSVFIVIRGIIDKNVNNGLASYFKPLGLLLTSESEKRAASLAVAPKKTVRRKRRTAVLERVNAATSRKVSVPTAGRSSYAIGKPDAAVLPAPKRPELLSLAVLLFLVVFNAFLFYKLWSLEAILLREPSAGYETVSRGCARQQELLDAMQQQQSVQSGEVERWRSLLEASVDSIEAMKLTIQSLKEAVKVVSTDRSKEL